MNSLKEAIILIKQAWNVITISTIKNNWNHTKILLYSQNIDYGKKTNDIIDKYIADINIILNVLIPDTYFKANYLFYIIDE